MTVGELIEELKKLPEKSNVIIQKDSEGNGYSPLYGLDSNCIYVAETQWSGEVYDSNWTHEDADMTKKEWDEILKKPRVVVLFPVN